MKIKENFESAGFFHKQLKRDGMIAIYERTKPEWINPEYEVVIISVAKKDIEFPNGSVMAKGTEQYPGASRWGSKGFTFSSIEKAEEKFNKLVEAKSE